MNVKSKIVFYLQLKLRERKARRTLFVDFSFKFVYFQLNSTHRSKANFSLSTYLSNVTCSTVLTAPIPTDGGDQIDKMQLALRLHYHLESENYKSADFFIFSDKTKWQLSKPSKLTFPKSSEKEESILSASSKSSQKSSSNIKRKE